MKLNNKNKSTHILLRFALISALVTLFTACSDDDNDLAIEDKIPSVEPIEAAMKTMTPLGYAASMFMEAINEPANTLCEDTVTNLCVTTLEIPFDPQTLQSFPVPLETGGTAKLAVAGVWSSSLQGGSVEAAVISLLFLDMKGGSFGFPTYKISTIPVSKTSAGVTTYYSTSDINVDKDAPIDVIKAELSNLSNDDFNLEIDRLKELLLDISDVVELNYEKDYWIVNVEDSDQNPTPNNYFDDLYSLSGGGVYIDVGISSGLVYQIGLANVVMGNNCTLNPSAGSALINELDVNGESSTSLFSLGSVMLDFDSTCDGQAQVRYGLGSYGPIRDQRVPLRFNE